MSAEIPKTGLCEEGNERRLVNQGTPCVTKARDETEELLIDLSEDTPYFFGWNESETVQSSETKTGGEKLEDLLTDISQDTPSFFEDGSDGERGGLEFSLDIDNHVQPDILSKKDSQVFRNHGRTPLIRDFAAERARPLPFDDEGTYGGGTRMRSVEVQAQTGASKPRFQPPVHTITEKRKDTETVEEACSLEDTDAIWGLNNDATVYEVDNLSQIHHSLPDLSITDKELSPSSFAKELLEIKLQELMVTQQKLEKYEKMFKKQKKEYIWLVENLPGLNTTRTS